MSYEQPAFHVTGGQGWINDPNGFSYFNNQYHLFYQYHPFSTQWGPMHWGHVVSSDLVHWERMPIALYPDQPYDKDGCFSGTALSLEDGRHLLMYTGVKDGYQAQCMAFGDGLSYEKYADNPVIDIQDKDFRDPKIWQEDGWFYMVAVHRAADGNGEALLYRSSDALHWEFCSQFASGRDQLNGMWEFTDFFQLNEHPMLLLSVMECDLFSTSRGVVALTGAYVDHQLNWTHVLPLDLGIDFYAPQTLRTSDGRHLMIGWMQNWATSKSVPEVMDWFGQMTLPRELRLE
ncbi:MAG: glycoside hydrolase family 32 protein, partial [Firmicutes bacterium]|nr:glycoside hydrolase family 32 protein [Bacillota bacterium]